MSDWMQRAACADCPTEWWFPEHATDGDPYATARGICQQCPVIDACLAHANESGSVHGMFGGRTPDERSGRAPRRRRGHTPDPSHKQRMALWEAGHDDHEISARLGSPSKTIASWRARNNLASNFRRKAVAS